MTVLLFDHLRGIRQRGWWARRHAHELVRLPVLPLAFLVTVVRSLAPGAPVTTMLIELRVAPRADGGHNDNRGGGCRRLMCTFDFAVRHVKYIRLGNYIRLVRYMFLKQYECSEFRNIACFN